MLNTAGRESHTLIHNKQVSTLGALSWSQASWLHLDSWNCDLFTPSHLSFIQMLWKAFEIISQFSRSLVTPVPWGSTPSSGLYGHPSSYIKWMAEECLGPVVSLQIVPPDFVFSGKEAARCVFENHPSSIMAGTQNIDRRSP